MHLHPMIRIALLSLGAAGVALLLGYLLRGGISPMDGVWALLAAALLLQLAGRRA